MNGKCEPISTTRATHSHEAGLMMMMKKISGGGNSSANHLPTIFTFKHKST